MSEVVVAEKWGTESDWHVLEEVEVKSDLISCREIVCVWCGGGGSCWESREVSAQGTTWRLHHEGGGGWMTLISTPSPSTGCAGCSSPSWLSGTACWRWWGGCTETAI